MKKENNYSKITLEQLAEMVAKGFAEVHEKMATKDELLSQIGGLRTEMNAGFAYINITLDKHMGEVRKQTDALARRVKRLEQAVFGVGK